MLINGIKIVKISDGVLVMPCSKDWKNVFRWCYQPGVKQHLVTLLKWLGPAPWGEASCWLLWACMWWAMSENSLAEPSTVALSTNSFTTAVTGSSSRLRVVKMILNDMGQRVWTPLLALLACCRSVGYQRGRNHKRAIQFCALVAHLLHPSWQSAMTVRNFPAVLSSVLLPVAISLPWRVSYHLFHFKAFRGLSCWPHEAKVWSSLCCYGLSLRGNQELVLQSLLLLRPTASLLNSNTILVQTSVGFHWDLWCQSREFALPVTARCASAHCWCNVGTYRLVDRSWLDFSKSILSSNRLFLHV